MARLRTDCARLTILAGGPEAGCRRFVFHPAFVCVLFHRVSHHLHRGGHRLLARLFWHLNVMITGADISPPADLGPGLVILNPPGVAISAHAGRNLTVMSCAGLGGELGRRDDIGAGPGLPVLGDDVVMEPHSGVLGPVRIGNRVRISAGAVPCVDVPDDTVVEGPRPRFLPRRDL